MVVASVAASPRASRAPAGREACRRQWRGGARSLTLVLLALLTFQNGGLAQSTPGEGEAVEWIRPEEVPSRADQLLRQLEAARPDAAAESSLARIEASLPQFDEDLGAIIERVTDALEASAAPPLIEDLLRELTAAAAPLGGWKNELAAEAARVGEVLDEVAAGERIWSETRGRPETIAAGDVVAERVGRSIEALGQAAANLRAWRARVLAASDRVLERAAAADAAIEKLRAAAAAERASLFVPDRAPLWSRGLGAEMRSELPRVPEEVLAYAESTAAYVKRDPRPLVAQVLLAAFLMFALGRFSARARELLAGEEAASRAARLLERPYSIGLLLALIASPAFHPLAPRRFTQLLALIALFPAARLVVHASERANPAAFAGLFVLLLLDRVGSALQALPALDRAVYLFTLAVSIGLAFWFWRRARRDETLPWLRRAANLAVWGLALALLAEIGGWTYLAALLGRGILGGAIAALYVYAVVIAVAALLAYALASRTARRSHLIARNPVLAQRRVERGLGWLGAALWLYLVMMALGLRSAADAALSALLETGVSVGALSLSIGGVIAFVLTLLAALLLARILTAILEAEVYPRTHLPRGVPHALSTLLRYGVYSLGFLFALAAAGVQLGQLTIMLGGLGVGIGLGLQDVVKNFAAGLTLLFERRLHVGDVLEMPSQGIFGHVLFIGMRASVVRTWSGAEVVVPNSDLVSNSITNWTLSDRLCRIEVPVGVAYGTDPERVVALLLDAVRSSSSFLDSPPPHALFKGFGESSLDFLVRAWTDQGYEQRLSLTSDLALAVHRKLREAGISIPFPQRDLHLASVSPAARAALSGVDRED